MRSYKVLVLVDSVSQAGSFWRSSGPFARLKKTIPYPIQFEFAETRDILKNDIVKWSHVATADVVWMHRPYSDEHKKIAGMCIDYGTKLIVDYDDNLLNIPYDNRTYNTYMDKKIHHNIVSIIFAADVVTVSTFELKRILDKYRKNKDCIVLKNSIHSDWWKFRNPEERAPKRRVMWRGSDHHQKDLLHVKEQIIFLANTFPDWEFFFVGYKPWYIIEETENCHWVSQTDVSTYFKVLHSVKPDITIVPLFDNVFNRCKSNIASLEGLMAAGIVVAPDWEEWRGIPGVYNYSESNLFAQTVHDLMKHVVPSNEHLKFAEEGWKFVNENYDLETTNMDRELIFNYVFGLDVKDIFDNLVEENRERAYGDRRLIITQPPSQIAQNVQGP